MLLKLSGIVLEIYNYHGSVGFLSVCLKPIAVVILLIFQAWRNYGV